MLDWIERKLNAAVKANHGDILTPSLRRSTLMAIGENHLLEGGTITFEVDSILTKLGVFKPSENGSHKGEPSSFQPSSSFWLEEIKAIWNRAQEQLLRKHNLYPKPFHSANTDPVHHLD